MCFFVKLFQIEVHSSFPEDNDIDDIKDDQNFSCVHRPTNTLNCSWSFQALQEDTQLSVSLRYTFFFSDTFPIKHNAGLMINKQEPKLTFLLCLRQQL